MSYTADMGGSADDGTENNFRAEVVIDDWRLIKELKTEQGVP